MRLILFRPRLGGFSPSHLLTDVFQRSQRQSQVKAEEDLYLTGSENTLRRVAAETNYSCLMLKTQRFSSLFRHYAKYHGLRKDDLEYYFCNILENEDTPESVQLQRGDTIMVRKRRPPPVPEAAADDEEFFRDLRELLDDEEHMDAVFYIQSRNHDNPKIFSAVPPLGKNEGTALTTPMMAATMSAATSSGTVASPMDVTSSLGDATNSADSLVQVRAHKCILAARAEYFKAYFRTGQKSEGAAFKESEECIVRVDPLFTERHIRWVWSSSTPIVSGKSNRLVRMTYSIYYTFPIDGCYEI